MTVPSDRYRLIERISEGPITTWSGFDETLGRPVTIRIASLEHESGQRMRVQTRALARMEHPNTLRVLDTNSDGIDFAVVTEAMPPITIADELSTSGPLPPREALQLAIEIGEALAALHQAGFAHGGVTLERIGRRANGHPVILDGPPTDDAVTIPATPAADLSSLAIATHHLLVGHPPMISPSGHHDLHPEIPTALVAPLQSALDVEANSPDTRDFLQSLRDKLPLLPVSRLVRDDRSSSFYATERAWFAPVAFLLVTLVVLLVAGAILAQTRAGSDGVVDAKDVVDISVPAPALTSEVPGTSEPRNASTSSSLQIVDLVDFDPEGDDRSENPDRLALINDDTPEDGWYTARYATNDFGGLKSGVGLILTLGPPQQVTQLTIGSPTLGWSVEIFASTEPVGQVLEWGQPIAVLNDIDGNAQLEFSDVEASTILVWITDLGRPLSSGGHRVTVTTLEVEGRPLFG